MAASLTAKRGTREDRRGARALLVMAAFSAIPLRAGADPLRKPALAELVPSVKIGVSGVRERAPLRESWTLDVWALLSWPLDPISTYDARARLPSSARKQAAADGYAQRLAEARPGPERALRAPDAVP